MSAFLRSVSPPSKFTQGFPVAPRLPPELLSAPADPLPDSKAARPKKRSLFMQQIMLKNKGVKTVINTPAGAKFVKSCLPSDPFVLFIYTRKRLSTF